MLYGWLTRCQKTWRTFLPSTDEGPRGENGAAPEEPTARPEGHRTSETGWALNNLEVCLIYKATCLRSHALHGDAMLLQPTTNRFRF